jgi:protein SERAC1
MLAKSIGLLEQTNKEILTVLQNDSEILARIRDSFYIMIRTRNKDRFQPIEITYFYEELPLLNIGTVSHFTCLE